MSDLGRCNYPSKTEEHVESQQHPNTGNVQTSVPVNSISKIQLELDYRKLSILSENPTRNSGYKREVLAFVSHYVAISTFIKSLIHGRNFPQTVNSIPATF